MNCRIDSQHRTSPSWGEDLYLEYEEGSDWSLGQRDVKRDRWSFWWISEMFSGFFRQRSRWVFPKKGVPQNGWFIVENPIKMDGGTPIFGNTQVIKRTSSMGLECCWRYFLHELGGGGGTICWEECSKSFKTIWLRIKGNDMLCIYI